MTAADILQLADEIIGGRRLGRQDGLSFLADGELSALCEGADRIRRALCGDRADLCTIVNGRSGGCPENCRYCAQSAHYRTHVQRYEFLDAEALTEDCLKNEAEGVQRYSIVTAGRTLTGEAFEKALAAYRMMSGRSRLILCASHGFMTDEQLRQLREAGVTMYHENIETSRRYFPQVCTTHTYDDKLDMIRRAKAAGLTICCGGIIGMGETVQDRIDMALDIAQLGVESIPLNALIPMKGTPFGEMPPITEDEILRTVALFRFIVPEADVRLAAGRGLMERGGIKAFRAGANSAVTGNMLTTGGTSIRGDIEMLSELGFTVGGCSEAENGRTDHA